MVARRKVVRVGAAMAALGATLSIGLAGNSPVRADPKQFVRAENAIGFGSDTTSQVMSAFSGYVNGAYYPEVHSHLVDDNGTPADTSDDIITDTQLMSWDATPESCITTLPGAPQIERPDGSGEGRGILVRARGLTIAGVDMTWGDNVGTTVGVDKSPCAGKNPSGLIDFARNSSGFTTGTTTGDGTLTSIPFAQDGLDFLYVNPDESATARTLSPDQLNAIFTSATGSATVGGQLYVGCDLQQGSGTRKDFFGKLVPAISVDATGTLPGEATMDASTSVCRNAGDPGDIQENSGAELTAKATAIRALPGMANAVVITGTAASAYIAKFNGASAGGTGKAQLGTMGGANGPDGVAGNGDDGTTIFPSTADPDHAGKLIASATYYANAKWGRLVSNILPTAIVTGPGNVGLKALFMTPTATDVTNHVPWDINAGHKAAICQPEQDTTLKSFGFLPTVDCGRYDTKIDRTQGSGNAFYNP